MIKDKGGELVDNLLNFNYTRQSMCSGSLTLKGESYAEAGSVWKI